MAVGGSDDTMTGSVPTIDGKGNAVEPELVANRYQIVRWLGGGGMGRVYEALDTELGERVALKVLRGGLSEDAIERFRREVRLTRRIQHKNVARMFDIGDHNGDKFLTMELVDGDPLGREIGRAMSWSRLKRLATQIAAGLAAAHDKGVIHRDLKPDNILIERSTDRAVITDFGIARSVDDAAVTQVGSVVGTPRYMSPEQLNARPVDARTDVFSFGAILYELATGHRPWGGDNPIAIAVAQATQPARPIASTTFPAGLTSLIARCLELEPERRPPTASEIGEALAALGSAVDESATRVARPARATAENPRPAPTALTSPPIATTLAVLPLTCGPGDEYLADGVVEDLIDTLSTTPGLRVRPAGVVRSRADVDPRELGRQLEVDHVVVGAVRRTPSGLRVSARLIGIEDGFQIWAHRADCTEAEILETSEQLGRGIATALSTRATSPTRPTDPRAVDLYLRARAEMRLFWGNHVMAAADLLDQAIELSPNSAPIAGARAFAATQAWTMSAEAGLAARAREAIERGLATGHAEAYLASASYKLNTGDHVGGGADLGTALVRAPMFAQAHEVAGRILVEIGAVSEARHHFETARALDPQRSHIQQTDLARLDALEGYWERADRALAAIVADPDRSISQLGGVFRARLAGWHGDRDVMIAAAAQIAPRMGGAASRVIEFVVHTAETDQVEPEIWKKFLSEFGGTDRPLRGQLMGLQILTEISLVLGRTELALDSLELADRLGLLDVVVLDKCVLFDQLSDRRRFRVVRASVAERAARVLAAFRSTAG